MNKLVLYLAKLLIIITIGTVSSSFCQSKFAIIGDFGDDDAEELAVSVLVKSWNPDYIITTGDNSYDATDIDLNIGKYYHEFIYPYVGSFGEGSPDSSNRFWVTLGNHDYTDGGGINAHYNYFVLPNNERYYDIVINGVHLFMVNSNSQESDGTSSTSTQANWIKSKMLDCLANHSHWRIVAFHHPPYSSGEHQSSTYMRWPFQTWGAHFVVAGHDHDYERLEVSGFPYFVNGTGGRNLRPFGVILPQSVFRDYTHFGAQLVSISNDTCYIDFWGTNGVRYDRKIIIDSALPVELSSFTAKVLKSRRVKLDWRTETEVSNYGFEIERSENPKSEIQNPQFEMIGFVEGNGNSNSPKNYSFTDDDAQYGRYAYRLKQIDTDGQFEYSNITEVDAGNIPSEIVLEQNYPNPFNPVTTIKFSIPESGKVRLSVYNLLGEEVAELFNGFLKSGLHSINFDASELNSGIYFYKFESTDFVQSRKMVLLK